MLTELETGLGLDVVLGVQAIRNGLFDLLATILHFVGGDLFYLALLPLIFWSLDRRLGLRLLFVLALSVALNAALKLLFQAPRPFTVSADVVQLVEQGGYGLPSGHVMNTVVVWGYAAYYLKRRWLYWAAAGFALLMAWGRMYAGVHYPQDVVSGALFGLLTLLLFIWLADRFPPFWQRLPPGAQAALIVLAGLVSFIFLFDDGNGPTVAGIALGAGFGCVLERRLVGFVTDGTPRQRAARYVVGISLVLGVFFGLRLIAGVLVAEGAAPSEILYVARYGLVTLLALFGWPWLAVRAGLMQNRRPGPEQRVEAFGT
jgi:membrane-associated phospholipid phosphatase